MIDLHTHSRASDGTTPPEMLPALAAGAGLHAVALTDHDTTTGIAAFCDAAKEFPSLTAISGVEISTEYAAKEIHLVGLFIDPENKTLFDFLARQRVERIRRNEMIFRKLASLGYPVPENAPEFSRFSDASSLGRPHFAAALCRLYDFSDMQEVFRKLLGHGRPAYVRRKLPDPAEAIAAIHASGGVAVWAHPVYRQRNEWALVRRFCKKFVPKGLDALECFYSLFGPPETEMLTSIAHDFGIARSGGSDFHGENSNVRRNGQTRRPRRIARGTCRTPPLTRKSRRLQARLFSSILYKT
ncbi:MAG: PHP domain-containing protein [Victivallaceae bacterium]|nr:PHP domain-containing protein [Victivallaceae bacterium]